ncbi:MAG: hypothetical protein R2752_13965 [Vicinamibacterales bacterium]
MSTSDLLSTLREFHRERLTLRQRHVAVARQVGRYEFNNTYQYIVNREDTHLQWLEAAILELGGTPDQVAEPALPAVSGKDGYVALIQQDARDAGEFVDRWRPRLPSIGNARHRNMMGVILGETLEQKRFFSQMVAGREDVLGRRANGPGRSGTDGSVMADRFIGWTG